MYAWFPPFMECLGVYPQKKMDTPKISGIGRSVTFWGMGWWERLSISECHLNHLGKGRKRQMACLLSLYPGSLGHESGKRRTCCASRTGKWSHCTSASSSCSHEYCKVSITWRTIPKDCERSPAISTDTKFGDLLECLRSWRRGTCKTWSHKLPRTWSLPTASCSGHLWPERWWPPFQEGHRSSSRGWTLESSEKKRNQKVPQFQLRNVFVWNCTVAHESQKLYVALHGLQLPRLFVSEWELNLSKQWPTIWLAPQCSAEVPRDGFWGEQENSFGPCCWLEHRGWSVWLFGFRWSLLAQDRSSCFGWAMCP